MSSRRPAWAWISVVVITIALTYTAPARSAGRRFFASLRLAKPQPVTANPTTGAGGSTNRQLPDAVAAMVTAAPDVTLDEADRPAPNADAAAALAGFGVHRITARHDVPELTVIGARDVTMPIDPPQLRTILDQAGRKDVDTPKSLTGSALRLREPRAVRSQYGHCPAPVSNTIQGQLQGPPPPSTDYGDCVVLIQSPPASADVPGGLAIDRLVEIALELTGMSPNQTRAFQQTFDWPSAMVLSLPRGMRSYELATVAGAPGMLINLVGRRGPTYALIWRKSGFVYLLNGYGNAGGAVPLASSVQ